MYKINFDKPIHIYFMGIGGISMSGLAEVLLQENFQVSGSDSQQSALTEKLTALGASIRYGQKAENLTADIDLIVYTAAIREDNPEYQEALRRGIPMLSRAELLGQMMDNYETPVAIAGTHGKTTTTSMISQILLEADVDPTISIGGILPSINGNIRVGHSGIFVTEACEYTNSFLHFHPRISVILNIEEDHMDYFRDLNHIRESFRQFAERLPADGTLIINGHIDQYETLVDGLACQILSYGENRSCDYVASDITYDETGLASFNLTVKGQVKGRIRLNVPGHHNVLNALSAIALAEQLEIPLLQIQQGLLAFKGTERRFEYKGKMNDVTIIDDYAHHPTEITATLTAARHYPHNNIWCVFQPHTYTRTKAFYDDFITSLSLADKIVLADIYAARETDTLGMSSAAMAEDLRKQGKECYYFSTFEEIEKFLSEKCMHGDLLITMGAGNVVNIGENLIKK